MLIVHVLVSMLIVAMTIILWYVARAGIGHYVQLYQNEPDAKKLNFIINFLMMAIVSLTLLICTLNINKNEYNTEKKVEVENGIRR
jgi:heme/copper-type cytochrome/quinol oxidase subunit 2